MKQGLEGLALLAICLYDKALTPAKRVLKRVLKESDIFFRFSGLVYFIKLTALPSLLQNLKKKWQGGKGEENAETDHSCGKLW